MRTHLLLIDPQNDFCDPKGTLFVPGADQDCARLAAFIDAPDVPATFDAVTVTLDCHSSYAIFHPAFWRCRDASHPAPFTEITHEAIRAGDFAPVDASLQDYTLRYTEALERGGRYKLCIWPPHCLAGTWGHCVDPTLRAALDRWEVRHPGKSVHYVLKGANPLTEHYSAFRPEVSDPADPPSSAFIASLAAADRIYVTGQALSHCVLFTLRDLVREVDPSHITLLADYTSPVTGFDRATCLREITDLGVKAE
jgi:nicotinamidase-related amidase